MNDFTPNLEPMKPRVAAAQRPFVALARDARRLRLLTVLVTAVAGLGGPSVAAAAGATLTMTGTVSDAATNSPWTGAEMTGAAAYATAQLSGALPGTPPSGVVTYSVYASASCTGNVITSSEVYASPSGQVPQSSPTAPLFATTFGYLIQYSDDPNYSAPNVCLPFTVVAGPSATSVVVDDSATGGPWSGTEIPGAQAYAVATVSGVPDVLPTGYYGYSLYAGSGCQGTAITTTTPAQFDATVPPSSATAALGLGKYSFGATYYGDTDYTASSGCANFAVGAPTATIATPANAGVYPLGQPVSASYACVDQYGPGLLAGATGCSGTVASGQPIDTAAVGPHSFSVTATSQDGLSGTKTVTYTVAAAPAVTITTPVPNASYSYGQRPAAAFSCTEGTDGPGISACTASIDGAPPIANGGALNDAVGSHTMVVTAKSQDGQTTVQTVSYTVTPLATSLVAAPQVVLFPAPSPVGLGAVSATLTAGRTPLPGQTVTFTVRTSHGKTTKLCSATTRANGKVTCSPSLLREPLVLTANAYTATYSGSTDYLNSKAITAASEVGSGLGGRKRRLTGHGTLARDGVRAGTVSVSASHGATVLRIHLVRRLRAGTYKLTLTLRGKRVTRTLRLGAVRTASHRARAG